MIEQHTLPPPCRTGFAAVLKALRVRRGLDTLELAVLSVLPEATVECCEAEGPLPERDISRRLRKGLQTAAPLSADELAVFNDLANLAGEVI